MFIETYYDERSTFCATSDEPAIPYPELVGEELKLWKRYLPTMRELENVAFWLHDNVPHLVMEQLEKAQKTPRLFDRIEIWSRTGDPMAVGVIGGKQTRYFSIARWGDAKLTLEQVKKRLWVEERMDVQAGSSRNDRNFFTCDIGSGCACQPRVGAKAGVVLQRKDAGQSKIETEVCRRRQRRTSNE